MHGQASGDGNVVGRGGDGEGLGQVSQDNNAEFLGDLSAEGVGFGFAWLELAAGQENAVPPAAADCEQSTVAHVNPANRDQDVDHQRRPLIGVKRDKRPRGQPAAAS